MVAFAAAAGLVSMILFLAHLCARQLAVASLGVSPKFLARFLDVSIAPLAIAFLIIEAMKIVGVLS